MKSQTNTIQVINERQTIILRPNRLPEDVNINNINNLTQRQTPEPLNQQVITEDSNWGIGHVLGTGSNPNMDENNTLVLRVGQNIMDENNLNQIITNNNHNTLWNHFMRYIPQHRMNNLNDQIIDVNSNWIASVPRNIHLNTGYRNRLEDITAEYIFSNRRFVYDQIPNIPNIHTNVIRPRNDMINNHIQNLFNDIFNLR
jgi:hypothetical protein